MRRRPHSDRRWPRLPFSVSFLAIALATPLVAGTIGLAVFVTLSKVLSPQYFVWMLPLLLVAGTEAWTSDRAHWAWCAGIVGVAVLTLAIAAQLAAFTAGVRGAGNQPVTRSDGRAMAFAMDRIAERVHAIIEGAVARG